MTRVAITGGIACGKSLVARFLEELGFKTVDADDIVHELIPADERRRLAAAVFSDPAARKALEAKVHPVVRERLAARCAAQRGPVPPVAVVPLLFEAGWEGDYDIVCCVASERKNQIARMMERRGYTREEAEARLAAQAPVEEKAARSDYVIRNDGTEDELRAAVAAFARKLKAGAAE